MSTYCNYFLRHNDTFLPIGDYSSCNPHCYLIKDVVPYGKMIPLTEDILSKLLDKCDLKVKENNKELEQLQEQKEYIMQANNSLNDKMHYIFDLSKQMAELDTDNDMLQYAHSFFVFLYNIIDSADVYKNEKLDVDVDNYVYAGIEVPMHPTINDIA